MKYNTHFLTPAQEKIIKEIARLERKNIPAQVPALITNLRYKSQSSVNDILNILERKGVIEIIGGGKERNQRLLRLTSKGKALTGLGVVPILGFIPAGPMAEAVNENDFVEASDLLKLQPGDFLLKAKGNSMIGDGIFDGDLVLLRPQTEPKRGEIAAVYAGDNYESTLKHVYIESKQVRLKASNPVYDDIIIPRSEWRGIAGVFRGLVRNAGN